MNNQVTIDGLLSAANACKRLDAAGVQVLGHYSNGRKPVLQVDHPPAGTTGVLTRRMNRNDGVDRVFASGFHGVQIEWTETVNFTGAVGHG